MDKHDKECVEISDTILATESERYANIITHQAVLTHPLKTDAQPLITSLIAANTPPQNDPSPTGELPERSHSTAGGVS